MRLPLALRLVRRFFIRELELGAGHLFDVPNERLDLLRGQTAGNLASREGLLIHAHSPCVGALHEAGSMD